MNEQAEAKPATNIWHLPVFGPEGEDVTWIEIKMRDSDGPGPFEKYYEAEITEESRK